jgi:hypothetical protein
MQERPPSLLGAAGIQAADAAIVLAASVLAGVDTATGQSYQVGSGIALTLIGLATAAALAGVAVGVARVRRWSRTPALLTQLFLGIVGIYLVQGHQYAWGLPCLALAVAGLVALLVPPSLRALAGQRPATGGQGPASGGQGSATGDQAASQPRTGKRPPAGKRPAAGKQPQTSQRPQTGKQAQTDKQAQTGKRPQTGKQPPSGGRPR